MLSVFLCDINQARIPSSVSEIDRQEFFNQDLNDDQNGSNEWSYYYRPSYGVVNAYFNTDAGESDICGENADATYDVIND